MRNTTKYRSVMLQKNRYSPIYRSLMQIFPALAIPFIVFTPAYILAATIPSSSSTVALESLDPTTSVFDMPAGNTITTNSGDGVTANNSKDWAISVAGNITGADSGMVLDSASGASIANSGTIKGNSGAGIKILNGGSLKNSGIIIGSGGTAIELSGSNIAVELQAGTLLTGDISSTGSGNTLTLKGNGSIASNLKGLSNITAAGSNWTLGGNITGDGQFTQSSGNVTLNGSNTYTGGTTITGGTLIAIPLNNALGKGPVTVSNGATLQLASTTPVGTVTNYIFSGNALSLNNATLSTSNVHSGTTHSFTWSFSALNAPIQMNSSTLSIRTGAASQHIFEGALHFSGNSAIKYQSNNYSQTLRMNGAITGDGTLEISMLGKATSKQTHINGNDNNFTGLVKTSGLDYMLMLNKLLGPASFNITGPQTVRFAGNLNHIVKTLTSVTTGIVSIVNSAGSLSVENGNVAGTLIGSGKLIKTSPGTLTLRNVNSYAGGTTINDGTLVATQGQAMGAGAVANNATLELNFAANSTLANTLSGSGSLNKTGAGTATLTTSGSTQGDVTVKTGTLALNQNVAFTADKYTTENGATSSLKQGATLNVNGNLSQNAGSTLNIELGTTEPVINAATANLDGILNVTGFTASEANSASALVDMKKTVITTTEGITGDFTNVNLGFTSDKDYLRVGGVVIGNNYDVGLGLTWLAGPNNGNGIFTLTNAADTFNVDVVLGDRAASATGWDGKTLTKEGDGTLILSSNNTYTGDTNVNAGTLQTGIINAFINSANVIVADGATLDLNDFAQIANNLSGAGSVQLGSADLTVQSLADTTFSGIIDGSGSLIKDGANALTLSGENSYSGGTTITNGTLIATQGQSMGAGAVANNAILELNFAADSALANTLSGSGSLNKTGAGTATLTTSGSSQGVVNVQEGILALGQNITFTADSYTTASGASTSLLTDSVLNVNGAFTQAAGSTLNVALGAVTSPINAATANLDGTLNITGFGTTAPTNASAIENTKKTIVSTTGGITGDFTDVILDVSNNADYLTLGGFITGNNYDVGFGLTWLAGTTLGDGLFTLPTAADTFNVDVVLGDEAASATGWDGKTLTKEGDGTLILSSNNTYTGDTNVNAGTLQTGIINAFINSANVIVADGATLDLNDFAQIANNLSGAGSVQLGSADLTVQSLADTTFSGIIDGSGSLIKDGANALTLSGENSYSGGTTITNGTLIATQGQSMGAGAVANNATLELNFAVDSALANTLSGSGSLNKTGAGTATLTTSGSSQGVVNVQEGILALGQNITFTADSYTTASGASTSLLTDSVLNVNGAFTQAAGSTLNVALGAVTSPINAATANLDGILNVTGFSVTDASSLSSTQRTIITTTGGISGDFSDVILDASSSADYLTLGGFITGNNYDVGFGLTWLAGTTLGDGLFTLPTAADTFNVDVVLGDEAASATGWDGKTLTKEGDGTLILSSNNTYTGDTNVNAGTLQTGIINAFINSANVIVADGATLDLNDFAQIANNLSGAGSVQLGSADLTVQSLADTTFSGIIDGSGSLIKDGANALTLSGENSYSGGTTITNGTLIATQGQSMGAGAVANNAILELNFAVDSALANTLSGSGSLNKTGAGTATLTTSGSSQGVATVQEGILALGQNITFTADSYTTASGASTSLLTDSVLNVNGAFTQAAGSTLNVALGAVTSPINAATANLDGILNVTGFSVTDASSLSSTQRTIITTTGGISGDFSDVILDASSSADYLTLGGFITGNNYDVGFGLTWLAGTTLGDGLFTLPTAADTFNVDVVLGDEAASATGWDGKTLTKEGDGTLILSSNNTYTGDTNVNAGTLQTGIINAFINSANVIVADGATLDLNDFAQIANNLSGAGSVQLGSADLTVQSLADTTFSGIIDGSGSLIKDGANALTLSGENSYSGGTTITNGTLIATQGQSMGAGAVANNAILELNFAVDSALANTLSGSGSLNKTGAGTATLTTSGSSQGVVNVQEGILALGQNITFTADSYTTASGASTSLLTDSVLNVNGAFTQAAGSTLNVALGAVTSPINAATASLDGTLNITGFGATAPTSASALTSSKHTIISTTGGITGDFSDINLGGASSSVDYLILDGGIDGNNYDVGFGLTWLAGTTLGDGLFTLPTAADTFNVDVVLGDEAASATGWDGKTLTKEGDGTLILSSNNTYTGDTNVNAGTLQTGIINAFINSANVIVADGATLDLNDFAQIANNLSGAGSVQLGSADLTVQSLADTTFSGIIDGSGSLIKDGVNALTLSGENSYSGGTIINDGIIVATQGLAMGTGAISNSGMLELNFNSDSTLANTLSGSGSLTKTDDGTATLTTTGSSQGAVTVQEGTLKFAQNVDFTADNYTTVGGASTSLLTDSVLNVNGAFTQAAGSTLNVVLGTIEPIINAATASLDGTLNITGFGATAPTSASALTSSKHTIISTTGGITGDFSDINLGGASSSVDYLILDGGIDGNNYDVGFGLTWLAGTTLGDGLFTLPTAADTFNVDVVLGDEAASATGWDGKTLTKEGDGTLILSSNNTYTGDTNVNAGTLQTGIINAFINSANVIVADGATLDLNDFAQIANNLSGEGNILLGNAELTANNLIDTTFGGVMSGSGGLNKTGGGTLTLTGNNVNTGASTITSGILQLGNGGASGSIAGDIANNGTLVIDRNNTFAYNSVISGNGNLIQQGSGTTLLSQNQSYTGTTDVNNGALILSGSAPFMNTNLVTIAPTATFGGYGGVAGNVINEGLLAIANAALSSVDIDGGADGKLTINGNLTNRAEIRIAGQVPSSSLVIKGNYESNSGLLVINTALGNDNSATDKLIVNGNTSGSTLVQVNNAGGAGDQTQKGIQIIEVNGQSDGEFTLKNRVVAGTYEYNLYKDAPDMLDGNWYLRSIGKNGGYQWRAESGVYLGNQLLSSLMQQHSYYDRQGEIVSPNRGAIWVRLVNSHYKGQAAEGNVDIDGSYMLAQLGGDMLTINFNKRSLQFGWFGGWGEGETNSIGNQDINGRASTSRGSFDGFNAGVYTTWLADGKTQRGAYIDSWIQYGQYNNRIRDGIDELDNYQSKVWSGSLEWGYNLALTHSPYSTQIRFIPQAQIIYNSYRAEEFIDARGTLINGQDREQWHARLGMRLSARLPYRRVSFNPFVETNWWHSGKNNSVTLDGMTVKHDIKKSHGEIKIGMQAQLGKKFTIWAAADASSDFANHERYGGTAGIRYAW